MNLFTEVNLNRLKLGLYGGLFFFSFFTIIAVPMTTEDVGGCLLYAEAGKKAGSDSNCNYCVAMAVIFGMLYGLFRLVTLVLLVLGKLAPDFVLFSDLCQLVYTGVDTVAWFLVFISACILSAGINSFCSTVIGDCSNYTQVSRLHAAEAGAWISFILWLVLMVVGIFWLFRQGKLPFISRSAQAGDSGTQGASGTTPQMDIPPASPEDPKY
ncbi:uncharacterized protein LOC143281043 [Babylonia areolata]|uniref:uncharacterized protein LOC143281043 n=1 Tax=Babylonia areolata TaxID=304850 RepID=UPI003FD1E3FE